MKSSIRDHRHYRRFIWLAFIGCILGIFFLVSNYYEYLLPYGDSVQYWAAGKLMISGLNPYSPDHVVQLRQAAGSSSDFPPNATAMMLYPPWSLPFLIPFGLFVYPVSRLLWLIANAIIIFFSIRILWNLYDGEKQHIFLGYIIAFTFAPTLLVLGMGHITTLHLFGIVGFLLFIQKSPGTKLNDFLAGAFISLVLIKPQLQYLLLIAIIFWVIYYRKWFTVLGGSLAIIGLVSISILFEPRIINLYWQSLEKYSFGTWVTPTIGSLLRWVFGWEKEWLQIFPIILGISWFLMRWQKRHDSWNWITEMPLLLLVCVITSPYTWTYDMVVLVIPLISILPKILQTHINWKLGTLYFVYVLVNFSTYYLHRYLPDNWFFLFAPLMLVLYLAGLKIFEQQNTSQNKLTLKLPDSI